MVNLRVFGVGLGAETYDASLRVHSIPRVGDFLSVWIGEEVNVQVDGIYWPTYGDFEDMLPSVSLVRPEDLSDEEWREVFIAIYKRRAP